MTERMEAFTIEYLDESEDGEEPEMVALHFVAPEGSDPDELLNSHVAICETYTPEMAQRIADLWNRFGGN